MFNGGDGIAYMSSVALSPKYDGVSLYERASYNGRLIMILRISHEEDANSSKILEKTSVEIGIPLRFANIVDVPETETLLDYTADFNTYKEYTEITCK